MIFALPSKNITDIAVIALMAFLAGWNLGAGNMKSSFLCLLVTGVAMEIARGDLWGT